MAHVVPEEPKPTTQISVSTVSTMSASLMGAGLVSQLQRAPSAALASASADALPLGAQPTMLVTAAPATAAAAPVKKLRREMFCSMLDPFSMRVRCGFPTSDAPSPLLETMPACANGIAVVAETIQARSKLAILLRAWKEGDIRERDIPLASYRGGILVD